MSTWHDGDELFVFGSLMDTDVLQLVTGLQSAEMQLTPVTATGFVQRRVAEENYPVLVAEPAGRAEGILISGLTATALDRVLFFEGHEYSLADIQVDLHQGSFDALVQRRAHYFKDAGVYSVTGEAWNFAAWQVLHKQELLDLSGEYMILHSRMTALQADAHWESLKLERDGSAPKAG